MDETLDLKEVEVTTLRDLRQAITVLCVKYAELMESSAPGTLSEEMEKVATETENMVMSLMAAELQGLDLRSVVDVILDVFADFKDNTNAKRILLWLALTCNAELATMSGREEVNKVRTEKLRQMGLEHG